jgi:hypothetical protein
MSFYQKNVKGVAYRKPLAIFGPPAKYALCRIPLMVVMT